MLTTVVTVFAAALALRALVTYALVVLLAVPVGRRSGRHPSAHNGARRRP